MWNMGPLCVILMFCYNKRFRMLSGLPMSNYCKLTALLVRAVYVCVCTQTHMHYLGVIKLKKKVCWHRGGTQSFQLDNEVWNKKNSDETNATKSWIGGHFISSPSTIFIILKYKLKMIPAVLKYSPPGGNTIIVQNQMKCFSKRFLSNVLQTFLHVGNCFQSV
jgi:hypothetical protein